MYLLNIQSSPRRTRSASIAVADAFLEAYRQICPEVIVDNLNVWQENLPEFDQEAIGAKYKGINQEPMNAAEQKVWDRIQELQNGLSPIPLEKLPANLFLERLNLEAQSRLAEVDDFCRTTEVQGLRERKKRTNMSKLHAA